MKVFGIGLSRTGTVSLTEALSFLGLRSAHYREIFPALRFEGGRPSLDRSVTDSYDAMSDLPVAACYPELDRRYRGAKFILTRRSREEWLRSCAAHFGRDLSGFAARQGIDYEKMLEFREFFYGSRSFDADLFAGVYDRFGSEVDSYFASRAGDLLILDVCGGEGWERLSPFLGLEAPDTPFPWANRTPGL